ncbi:MAG: phage holin [Clostridiales bacterium]
MNMNKENIQIITRAILLLLLLVNQIFLVLGWHPLNISEDIVFSAVSTFAMIVVVIRAWWKNNNFTKESKEAQNYMNALKRKNKVS